MMSLPAPASGPPPLGPGYSEQPSRKSTAAAVPSSKPTDQQLEIKTQKIFEEITTRQKFAKWKRLFFFDFWEPRLLQLVREHIQELSNHIQQLEKRLQQTSKRHVLKQPWNEELKLLIQQLQNVPQEIVKNILDSFHPTCDLPMFLQREGGAYLGVLLALAHLPESEVSLLATDKSTLHQLKTKLDENHLQFYQQEISPESITWSDVKPVVIAGSNFRLFLRRTFFQSEGFCLPGPVWLIITGPQLKTQNFLQIWHRWVTSKTGDSEAAKIIIQYTRSHAGSLPRADKQLQERACEILNQFLREAKDQSIAEEKKESLILWYQFCKDFLGISILPECQKAEGRLKYTGSVPQDIHKKPQRDTASSPGTILDIDSFVAPKLLPIPKEITWTLSAGDCPEAIWEVSSLPTLAELKPPKELEEWQNAAQQLLFCSEKDGLKREDAFKQQCTNIGKRIKDQGAQFEKWFDPLVRRAYGLDEKGCQTSTPNEDALKWFKAMQNHLHIPCYPQVTMRQSGNKVTLTWDWQSLANQPLSMLHNWKLSKNDGYNKATVVECSHFSISPAGARIKISRGPEQGFPPVYQYIRQMRKRVQTWKSDLQPPYTQLLQTVSNLEGQEFLAFVSDGRLPVNPQEVEKGLRNILGSLVEIGEKALQRRDTGILSELDNVLENCQQWSQHHGIEIHPRSYRFKSTVLSELSEQDREYCDYLFLSWLPRQRVFVAKFGYKTSSQGFKEEPRLCVSAGAEPEGFQTILQLAKSDPQAAKIAEYLRTWPWELATQRSEEDFGKRRAQLFGKFYETVYAGPQLSSPWKDTIEKWTKAFGCQSWQPLTPADAEDKARVRQKGTGNKFRVTRPALYYNQDLLVAAEVELYF